MGFRPMLFNTKMVRAIQDGQKTQTRRTIKPQPTNPRWNNVGWTGWDDGHGYCMNPPCMVGDVLWVRETWRRDAGRYMYRANYADNEKFYRNGQEVNICWKPSIHMPKEAARIFLRVKDVRVERLQDMDEEAAIAEGFADSPAGTDSPLERFYGLWDKTLKRDDLREYGYHANPWVWVIEFERIEKNEGWCR